METRRRITSGGGDPRESATERKPPASGPARVKGCGKSAPRRRQRRRHGKPRREQDRIGATRARQRAQARLRARCSGWLHEAASNGRPRGMADTRVVKSPRALQNPAYRPTGDFFFREF
jgi:hypothetical protein